ncbi:bifunctional 5,10-methylene-tetrahydrofolate dehydrogenase/5,10-methylene-tetrahydrofolate cyclohydrolase [Rozella allomycis CSF55]|uniref:Bifunctional 5,10-methylene-tetrahydrofolate dehydrogenase/5,10-methylene-tetrahydrofolate cyclohydrolase n=1 Tax=Rozella allomycis (strain CSF55) TaxID=988480 RepID=A0A4P9YHB4_ROZAC|nr:bifunctional 5,10-methylene-tetrahydrofolate dehydrogenase/5,10-methylene-tetrahydrofolate cyclohydrolase [Rozella allomycis CSF55]
MERCSQSNEKNDSITRKLIVELKDGINYLKKSTGIVPRLAVLQVGDREDSNLYIKVKENMAKKIVVEISKYKFNEDVHQRKIFSLINSLNLDPNIHGIIVQLPLPNGFSEFELTEAIDCIKDVDGFHSSNLTRITKNCVFNPPCTPSGIIRLLSEYNIDLEGKLVTIVGRSSVVGIPLFHMLNNLNATVTLCHSKTRDLESMVKMADIVISAVGKPALIKGHWIKPGAIVVDVGISYVDGILQNARLKDSSKKSGKRIVGDVDFENALKNASLITPVPGGVGNH